MHMFKNVKMDIYRIVMSDVLLLLIGYLTYTTEDLDTTSLLILGITATLLLANGIFLIKRVAKQVRFNIIEHGVEDYSDIEEEEGEYNE